MHTLVVCDTEPIAIEGLRNLLEPVNGFRIIAAESSLPMALDAIRELTPAVLLVDKAFGIQSVMDCLRELRDSQLPTATVVWGLRVSEAESVRLLQAGCSGVVRKTAHQHTLTNRELQVRDLVERGMKNKDIAVALGIRTGTVKIHLKHIFEKTGIHGRYGLASSGLKEKGLLAPTLVETM